MLIKTLKKTFDSFEKWNKFSSNGSLIPCSLFDIKKNCFQSQMWCINIHIKLDQRNKSGYLKNPDDGGLDNQSLIVINCKLCGHI